jgi:hypothetical protein
MQQLIKHLEKLPVSMARLQKAAPSHCKVVLYDKLPNTVSAMFGDKSCVIILYQLHSEGGRALNKTGHYSLVFRKDGKLHYFSSYALRPEQAIGLTHSKGKLLRLLGKNYTYNRTVYQPTRDTQTCGLHCLIRSYMYRLKPKAYRDMMTRRIQLNSADDVATAMCIPFLIDELVQKHRTLQ